MPVYVASLDGDESLPAVTVNQGLDSAEHSIQMD